MSYAIIRNAKYTMNNLNVIFRHNERKNTNYSNKDINKNSSVKNYSIKSCNVPYSKAFNQIKQQYHLKGQLKKTSNVVCEYIITSDKEFFEEIGEAETKRYFETAYKFVCSYKNLGEQYIISAKVHMDEKTPHLHLVFIPVVHTQDNKTNKLIDKISCTEFWKGKNSYKQLQDKFYSYMTKSGFDLDRGRTRENEHIPIKELKAITNHEVQEYELKSLNIEKELETNNIDLLKQDYRRIIKKFNTLQKQYTKIKITNDNTLESIEKLQKDCEKLQKEKHHLNKYINYLKLYIDKIFEVVNLTFDFPKDRFKNIVNNYLKSLQEKRKDNRNEREYRR